MQIREWDANVGQKAELRSRITSSRVCVNIMKEGTQAEQTQLEPQITGSFKAERQDKCNYQLIVFLPSILPLQMFFLFTISEAFWALIEHAGFSNILL